MRVLLSVVLLVFAVNYGWSQQEKKIDDVIDFKVASLPYYSYGKGLGLTSPDSLFQLNIRFRMQNRAQYVHFEDGEEGAEAFVRRLRLRFDGYVGDPRFMYAIQLSFAPDDVGVVRDGDNINIIRDAVIYYQPNSRWNLSFGQTKLPGNRQRINSSGGLQLTDRTINNASFNIDRDFGIQAHYNNKFGGSDFHYGLQGAISTGDGRNENKNKDLGLAYTAKAELYPFGRFKKNGAYFEGDIAREETPKLLLSAVYHFNKDAKSSQGQTGTALFETRDLQSILLDANLKYKGFSALVAHMQRMASDPLTYDPNGELDPVYVYVGNGQDVQLSYNFESNIEVIGRFSSQKVHDDIAHLAPHKRQYGLGVTKYIWEHAFKIQAEVGYNELYASFDTKDDFYVRFQIEIGI